MITEHTGLGVDIFSGVHAGHFQEAFVPSGWRENEELERLSSESEMVREVALYIAASGNIKCGFGWLLESQEGATVGGVSISDATSIDAVFIGLSKVLEGLESKRLRIRVVTAVKYVVDALHKACKVNKKEQSVLRDNCLKLLEGFRSWEVEYLPADTLQLEMAKRRAVRKRPS